MVRTPPFHGGNTGSNPVRVTTSLMNFSNKIQQILDLKNVKQIRRFLLTGGISTVISYSVFLLSIHLFSLHYIISNIVAFCVSITFSYNFNKRWSFEVANQQRSHLFSYLGLYLFSLALGSLILKIAVDFCGIIPEISFIISLCFTTTLNFLGVKFLVFKK